MSTRTGTALAAALVAALAVPLAACGTGTTPATAPSSAASRPVPAPATSPPGPSPTTASPRGSHAPTPATSASRPRRPRSRASHLDTWRVGAHPLPLRPDGFGKVERTPPQLRVRRMPTQDLLPPPRHGRFASSIGPVTPAIRRRMGQTWSPRCPVALKDLRYLTVAFHGFDGRAHTGELVVNARVARDLVRVFRRLYAAGFPIESMRLPTTADLVAPPTGDGNNTAAMVCRATRTTTSWSAHAYGIAIDVNPFMNPYHKGDLVLPELAGAYLDRSWRRPGMIVAGGVVTRAFASIGWTWGGSYRSLKDLMHFSANGR